MGRNNYSRRRSSSGGSFSEMKPSAAVDDAAAQELLTILINLNKSKSFLCSLAESPANVNLAHALLERAQSLQDSSILELLLKQADDESGYTPLHWAVWNGSLAAVLVLLRQTATRFTRRPMDMLAEVDFTDNEGFTPLGLLGVQQQASLQQCREALEQRVVVPPANNNSNNRIVDDEQDELALLGGNLHLLQVQTVLDKEQDTSIESTACEVVTFGRSHHVALGVPCSDATHPQRVAEFGLDLRDIKGSAVVVAAATHHSLVVTTSGHLYACGLGKGGRLGTGDELECPLFTRVKVSRKRRVVHAAAAENHSLCVTQDGRVYAFGSNRFGQLGISGQDRCLFPRKVEDLRSVVIVKVAAGDKHSMALSTEGQVYTWGDNQAGQLGTRQSSSTGKVQLVESLWNATPRKIATAICASGHSSLILTKPSVNGLPVNTVYQWGHGNRVPIKVNFVGMSNDRHVNPIDIACAKYHNAAVTRDGFVFTWGLHAESLGTNQNKSSMVIASPQLVEGMLPENGGGHAVTVSAAEHHTSVVTDSGHLFTWGATFGKNILGHEGVRWQPSPKKVAGIHRAVSVAAGKEHNVVLMGTSFPIMPPAPTMSSLETLAARQVAKHVDLFNVVPILITAERAECSFLKDYCQEFIRQNLDGVLNLGRKSEMDCYLNEQLAAGFDEMDRDAECHPLVYDIVMAGTTSSLKEFDAAKWMEACKSLLERLPVSTLVKYRLSASNGSGSMISRRTLCRSRTLSIHDDDGEGDHVSKPGECSERCLMLTANMNVKTTRAAQSKFDTLTKEVRSVRKRLNQIAKLQLAESLAPEQQQKVQRKALLETDLSILEPALKDVEARLRDLKLEEEVEEISSSYMEAVKEEDSVGEFGTPESDPTAADIDAVKKLDAPENDAVDAEVQVFRCDLCNVSCSDANNLALHKSGRKHRNRIKQAEEEEEKKVAASILEDKRKQMMLSNDNKATLVTPSASAKKKKKSPWDKQSPSPRFRLPPPPHFPSLEEATTKTTPSTRPAAKPIRKKSITGMKPPPASPAAATLLNPGNIPALASPPWASPAARLHVASAPAASFPIQHYSSQVSTDDSKKTYSLGDFLAPPSTSAPVETRKSAPWSAPSKKASCPSLADIQQQQEEIQNNLPATRVEGKWFVGERVRAGSISAIQEAEQKSREERLFVEEQRLIEEQIQRERRQEEQKKKNRKARNKKKKGSKNAGMKSNAKASGGRRKRPSNRKKSNAGEPQATKTSPSV